MHEQTSQWDWRWVIKPMLAHVYDSSRWIGGPVWIQPKFNGVRALYQKGRFQSRDELPWPADFLQHLADPLMHMFGENSPTILDGELYYHSWPLQRINQAVAVNATVRGATDDTREICYMVFDQVAYNRPFFLRFGEVSQTILVGNHPQIQAATTVETESHQYAEDFYARFVGEGFEGIMYRIGTCPYTHPKQPRENAPGFLSDKNNRTWHLLKRKSWQDDEFKCIAVEEGEGKRAGKVGRFVCITRHGVTFGVGSGISDAEATAYFDHPPIDHFLKVQFLTYTSDGRPFNPTVMAVL